MSSRLRSQQKPETASWSKGAPPTRPATTEDWAAAPRLCSLAQAAWLLGISQSQLRGWVATDSELAARICFRPAGSTRRMIFSKALERWAEGLPAEAH